MNALDDGWKVSKTGDHYIFCKKHENKKEILSEEYLDKFIAKHVKTGRNLFSKMI